MTRHIAHAMPFAELYDGLRAAKEKKLVSESRREDGLSLWVYSQSCVYDRAWDDITMAARGLILDPAAKRIVASPFPKFFNVGERADSLPALPFEVFTKLDGSLIVIWNHSGRWCASTKGSFRSDQAKWAQALLDRSDLSSLDVGVTYLAEYIGPSNRIVVRYPDDRLIPLAAYDAEGWELPRSALAQTAGRIGWGLVDTHAYGSVADLLAHTKTLPADEEGFVLRFENGLRVKIKGDEYLRIHRLVSDVTPLGIWRAMEAGDDRPALAKELPEEFLSDYERIIDLLGDKVSDLVSSVRAIADPLAALSDKEVGLRLAEFPEPARGLIFPYRKGGGDLLSGRARGAVFKHIRPTGNALAGYEPSSAMNRVAEENL